MDHLKEAYAQVPQGIIKTCTKQIWRQGSTNLSAVFGDPHATAGSATFSANRDNWELPGLVSALRGRAAMIGLVSALLGRDASTGAWFEGNNPDAVDGCEFEPHAFEESWDLSLPAVDGLVPLPPDDGRPLLWHGEPVLPSVLGDNRVDEPHTFEVAEQGRLPQVRVPLQLAIIMQVE